MQPFRLLLLVVVFSLAFTISSSLAAAGCCLYAGDASYNYCLDIDTPEECCGSADCGTAFQPGSSCDDVGCNDNVCCLDTCDDTGTMADCQGGNFVVLVEGETCFNSPIESECDIGCCVGVSGITPVLCSDAGISLNAKRTRKECTNTGQFDFMLFYKNIFDEPGNLACSEFCTDFLDTGSIIGHVTSVPGSAPIASATVQIPGLFTVQTDSVGFYEINLVPVSAIPYSVTASHGDYQPVAHSALISDADSVVTLDFELPADAGAGNLSGFILDESSSPVSAASVAWVLLPDEASFGSVISNAGGAYSVPGLASGEYRITVSASGFAVKIVFVTVVSGQKTERDIILSVEGTPVKECGNNIVEHPNDYGFNEECDGTADTIAEGADADCEGYCDSCVCPDNCEAAAGLACADFDYQCTGSYVPLFDSSCQTTANNAAVDYPSFGCCDSSIIPIPACTDGTLTNHMIGSDIQPLLIASGGDMCYCGNGFYNASMSSAQADGFCCNINSSLTYQESPCSLAQGRLYGYVSELLTGVGINNVKIDAGFGHVTFTGTKIDAGVPRDGYYQMDFSWGTYDVNASKWPFYYDSISEEVNIVQGAPTELNFTLEARATTCDGDIPKPVIELKHVRGRRIINVTWRQPCSEYVYLYFLYRDGKYIGTFSRFANYFEDRGDVVIGGSPIAWNTSYHYMINATTSSERGYNYSNSTILTGDSLCEGIVNYSQRICVNDNTIDLEPIRNQVASCTNGNQVQLETNCSAQAGSDCVGPVDGFAWCSVPDDCPSFGVIDDFEENYLGLYYFDQYGDFVCTHNVVNDERKYCYLDYSSAPTDTCNDCSQEEFCYDYQSEDACLRDNCYYGPSRSYSCNWVDSYFVEWGKGYCYAENYTGTDYCSLCGNDPSYGNEFFFNSMCTTDICSKLGRCYSSGADFANCLACTSSTRCSEYIDEESCIGSSAGFKIPGSICAENQSALAFNLSDDLCGLGRCQWNYASNTCYKDGDYNMTNDCPTGSSDCLADNLAPNTIIVNKPAYINTQGATITFSSENGAETYFCIETVSTATPNYVVVCCPNFLLESGSVVLPGANFSGQLNNTEGTVFMSFYSVDVHKNIEAVKTEQFYIDTLSPTITVLNQITNNSKDNWTSNIDFLINISEHSTCTARLHKGAGIVSPTQLLNTPLDAGINHRINYSGLDDGFYILRVECTDDYANLRIKDVHIPIDRIHGIFDASPNSTTLNSSSVNLHIKTTASENTDFCRYQQIFPVQSAVWFSFNPLNALPGEGILDPEDGNYTYDSPLFLASSSLYEYEAQCWDTMNFNQNMVDSTNIYFTVDLEGPDTRALYQNITNQYLPIENSYYPPSVMIKINCTDSHLGPPDEFGCSSNIHKCISNSDCDPNVTYPSTLYSQPSRMFFGYSSGSYRLCSKAKDLGGNWGPVSCSTVKIDADNPSLVITNPANNSFFEAPKTITVNGTWNDLSSISRAVIKWYNLSAGPEGTREVNASISSLGIAGKLNATIELFNGPNTIETTVYDSVGNSNTAFIKVISDNMPPVINNIWYDPTQEYKELLFFNASITDPEWTLNVTSASLHLYNYSAASDTGCISEMDLTLVRNTTKDNSTFFNFTNECLEVSNYTAVITASDVFGNQVNKSFNFTVRDTKPPKLNITILDQITGLNTSIVSLKPDRSPDYYDIIITSDTPLYSIGSLSFSFTSFSGSAITRQITGIAESAGQWQGLMTISGADILNLNNAPAVFHVTAHDLNMIEAGDNEIQQIKTFIIDTAGPASPVIYDPINTLIYTKDSPVYFTGLTSPGQKVEFYKSDDYTRGEFPNPDEDSRWSYENDATAYPSMESNNWTLGIVHGFTFEIKGDQDSLEIKDDKNHILFNSSSYMRFSSDPRSRHNYMYYDITGIMCNLSCSTGFPVYKVTFSPPIENALTNFNQVINLYSQPAPGGWFDSSLALTENNINYFYAVAFDEYSNKGDASAIYQVIYDTDSPGIFSMSPEPDSISPDNRTTISFRVSDNFAVNISTLLFTFNGTTLRCNEQADVKGWLECHAMNAYMDDYNLTYHFPNSAYRPDLLEGEYNVAVNVSDNAKNSMSNTWNFDIDTKVPLRPEITVLDGFFHNNWYTSSSAPQIDVRFQDTEIINMTRAVLETASSIDASFVELQPSFLFQIQGYSGTPAEGLNKLKIYARKQLDGQWGGEGIYIYNLYIDRTAPHPSINIPRFTNNRELEVGVNSDEALTSILLTDYDFDDSRKPVNISVIAPSTKVNITGDSGTKTMRVEVEDLAHNSAFIENATLLDIVKPSVGISITSPALQFSRYTEQTSFAISCSCTDSVSGCNPGTQSIYYRLQDSSSWTAGSSSLQLTVPAGGDATYIINCTQADNAGNFNSSTHTVTVIQGAPSIHFIRPQYNYTNDEPNTVFEVMTSQPAECEFSWGASMVMPEAFESRYSDDTFHEHIEYIQSEKGEDGVPPARLDFTVMCTSYGRSKTVNSWVIIDKTPIIIENVSLLKGTYVTDNYNNTLVVETNKNSFCKYSIASPNEEPSSTYDELLHNISTGFAQVHYKNDEFNPNAVYTLVVNCRDIANNPAQNPQTVQFQVEVGASLEIQRISTEPGLVNNRTRYENTTVFAETNKPARCEIGERGLLGIVTGEVDMAFIEKLADDTGKIYYRYSLMLREIEEGSHTYKITCHPQDSLGGNADEDISFEVDTAIPDAPVLLLANNSFQNTEFSLEGYGVSDIAVIRIYVDNNFLMNATTTLNGFNAEFNETVYIDDIGQGKHKISAYAYDELGNGPSNASERFFLKDDASQAPELHPLASNYSSDSQIALSGNAEPSRFPGANSWVKFYYYNVGESIDDSVWAYEESANELGNFSASFDLHEGRHYIFATQIDSMGNPESLKSNIVAFTVDFNPPAISNVWPSSNSMIYGRDIVISADIEDDFELNLSSILLKVDNAPVQFTSTTANEVTSIISSPMVFTNGLHSVNLSARDMAGNYIDTFEWAPGPWQFITLGVFEDCNNGLDDDLDTLVDCDDSDCGPEDSQAVFAGCDDGIVEICNNGGDDDFDLLVDCNDPDCQLDTLCGDNLSEICNNDNDNEDPDLDVDCNDNECGTALPGQIPPYAGCIDSIVEICDNYDNSSPGAPVLIDDDYDSLANCNDPDCQDFHSCRIIPIDEPQFSINSIPASTRQKNYVTNQQASIGISYSQEVTIIHMELAKNSGPNEISNWHELLQTSDNKSFTLNLGPKDENADYKLTIFAANSNMFNRVDKLDFKIDITPPEIDISNKVIAYVSEPEARIFGNFWEENLDSIIVYGSTLSNPEINFPAKTYEKVITLAQGGLNHIDVNITDKAGFKDNDSITINYDNNLPTVAITDAQDTIIRDSKRKIKQRIVRLIGTFNEPNFAGLSCSHTFQKNSVDNVSGAFDINVSLDYTSSDAERFNNITVYVTDKAGNKGHNNITVYYDNKKPVITLDDPVYHASRIPAALINVTTDEWSGCSAVFTLGTGVNAETYTLNLTPDASHHKHKVKISPDLPIGAGTPMKIYCLDSFANQQLLQFDLFVDNPDYHGNPNITDISLSNMYAKSKQSQDVYDILVISGSSASGTALFRFQVDSSEDNSDYVRCKYGTGSDWNSMTEFEGFAFSMAPESQFIEQAHGTTRDYYIICEDKVGKRTQAVTANIEVDLSHGLAITVVKPSAYTNAANPNVMVTTGIEPAFCTANHVGSPSSYAWNNLQGIQTENMVEIRRGFSLYNYSTHLSSSSINFVSLSDNNDYEINVECHPANSNLESSDIIFSFHTDYTNPAITFTASINNSESDVSEIIIAGTTEPYARIAITSGPISRNIIADSAGAFNSSFPLQNGSSTIEVTAVDLAGNRHTEFLGIKYVNTGPSVVSITPADGAVIRSLHNVTAVLEEYEGSGIDLSASSIEMFYSDGTPVAAAVADNSIDTLYLLIANALMNDDYTVRVIPVAASFGKIGLIRESSIIINQEVPEVTNMVPAAGANVTAVSVVVSSTINTFNQEYQYGFIFINNHRSSIGPLINSGFNTYPFSMSCTAGNGIIEGRNNITYEIGTTLGNVMNTTGYYFIRDTTGPDPQITVT